MYYFLSIFLLTTLFFALFFHFRKRKIITKVACMTKNEKCDLLNELVHPFGYYYHCNCGCFSATLNAWQKKAGYTYLYDYMAPRFQMVFDFLPVYFNYANKTWLIEFWKGQYGINVGAEIGIYHTDRIIPKDSYKTSMFEAVATEEMLPCSFLLYNPNGNFVHVKKKHWWLTAFFTGQYSNPSQLIMENTITFPNHEMLSAFIDGLKNAGYSAKDFTVSELSITFLFHHQNKQEYHFTTRLWCRFSQWKNKNFCRLYLWITSPFHATEDRILYLYYYLPFAFRKVLRMHRFHKRCHRKKLCMRKAT